MKGLYGEEIIMHRVGEAAQWLGEMALNRVVWDVQEEGVQLRRMAFLAESKSCVNGWR
jgi:hypothetical protein